MTIAIIIGIVAAGVLVYVFLIRKDAVDVPEPPLGPVTYLTREGAKVYSKVNVPMEALTAIDAGLQAQIQRMPPEWSRYRFASAYSIEFLDPQATNVETEPGSPALIISGIQCAGYCRNTKEGESPVIVLPHQQATAWRYLDYLMNSTWYEAEHVAEAVNDRNEFIRWAYPNPDVHPHRP